MGGRWDGGPKGGVGGPWGRMGGSARKTMVFVALSSHSGSLLLSRPRKFALLFNAIPMSCTRKWRQQWKQFLWNIASEW